MNYQVKGSYRYFELYNGDRLMGTLDYDSLTTLVTITIDDDEFRLGLASAWGTGYRVVKDDDVYAYIDVYLGGTDVVQVIGNTFSFKPDFWHTQYTLSLDGSGPIAVVMPQNSWVPFQFNYEIDTDDAYPETHNPMLLLCLIYCCNCRKQLRTMQRV